MFEDKYKKDMENVKLSDKAKINPQELIKSANASKKAAHRRWLSATAAVLLVCIGFASFFPASKLFTSIFADESENGGNLLEGIIPPPSSQDVSDTENAGDTSQEGEAPDSAYLLSNYDSYEKSVEILLDYFQSNKSNGYFGSSNDSIGNTIDENCPDDGDFIPKDRVCGAYADSSGTSFLDIGTHNTNAVTLQKIVYDENFIYVLNNSLTDSFITVYSVSNGKIARSTKTVLPMEDLQYGKYAGMFLLNGRLCVVRDYARQNGFASDSATYIHIFNVTKNCTLEESETFIQTGHRNTIQADGDKLYITTGYSIPQKYDHSYDVVVDENGPESSETELPAITKEDIMSALPVSGINGGKTVSPESIYFPSEIISSEVFVITGFDLQTFGCNTACVIDETSKVYAADGCVFKIKGMFTAENGYYMDIDRFSFEECVPVYSGSARVSGQFFNAASFDLYDNRLRIALVKDEKHGFAVLDESLSLVSEIYREITYTNIPDVRFTDNSAGYIEINTLNTVLFAADLSANRELEITSESNGLQTLTYLKSFGKDQIFGYGTKINPETKNYDLTITIYDFSDPLDITEKINYDLGPRKNPVWQMYDVVDTMVFDNKRELITVTYRENIVLGEGRFNTVYCIEAFRCIDSGLVSIGKFQQEAIQIDANTAHVPTISSVIIGDHIYIVLEVFGVPSLYAYSASDFSLTDTLK